MGAMIEARRDCAGPEGAAAPSLMLEYQKSRRRRSALGPGGRSSCFAILSAVLRIACNKIDVLPKGATVPGNSTTSAKLVAMLSLVAKSAFLFTAGRYALRALEQSFPAQMWLLKPVFWVCLSAVFAYFVLPPFLRVVEGKARDYQEDSRTRD